LERFQRVDSVFGFFADRKRLLGLDKKLEKMEEGDLE